MPTATHPRILQIAVPTPLYGSFDYLPPRACDPARLQAGMRLRLPFGRGHVTGILLGVTSESRVEPRRLRAATALLDEAPLLTPDLLALGQWAAQYYHHPIGEVFAALLPTLLRQGKSPHDANETQWRLTAAGRSATAGPLQRAPRQAALLQWLQQQTGHSTDAEQLAAQGDSARAALRALIAKGWVEEYAAPVAVAAADAAPAQHIELNETQDTAVEKIGAALHQFAPFVLEGVTGSGKTEVYLELIARVATAGRQTLVLVPEIGLTPQLVARFAARLRHPTVVLHSGLSDKQRLRAWAAAASGEAKLIIGTRSAVFTPLHQAGLIIIDEEHDPSFKQEDGVAYNARDMAIVRGQLERCPVVLV